VLTFVPGPKDSSLSPHESSGFVSASGHPARRAARTQMDPSAGKESRGEHPHRFLGPILHIILKIFSRKNFGEKNLTKNLAKILAFFCTKHYKFFHNCDHNIGF
jgi:hypothetical protein